MAETYTGDEGDEALAAGLDVMDGTEDRRDGWLAINKTRDMIAQGTGATTPIAEGGTGATTAAAARVNLGLTAGATAVAALGLTASLIPSAAGNVQADLSYLGGAVGGISGKVAKTGDTMSGDLYLPASSAAVSSYTVAYINGDGRVSRGASSLRYKENVTDVDPAELDGLFDAPLHEFEMIGGDGSRILGYIAEELAENPATDRFVVRIENTVESIDFIQFLLARTANLEARLRKLEDKESH